MRRDEILLIEGTDYREMTKELLCAASLIGHIADRGCRIGIKPNLVSPSEASCGATTHPEIVAGIIEYLRENGCTDIAILEGSWVGDVTADAFSVCGYDRLTKEYGVPFLDMQKEKGVKRDCAGMELSVCRAALEVDFLINVPVLKGHCQTRMTCALKNMKGLIPNAEKRRFHKLGLHEPIAHLNTGLHQDFIVVDNICGDLDFEDGGNPVVRNRILAAADPCLADALACAVIGIAPSEVPYLTLARELGVGSTDLGNAYLFRVERGTGERMKTALSDIASGRREGKLVALRDAVEEVDSCSACYGYLIPALEMLRQEGLLARLSSKICIGQGYRGKSGELGVGNCTAGFSHCVKGCPPTETEIYRDLKAYLDY